MAFGPNVDGEAARTDSAGVLLAFMLVMLAVSVDAIVFLTIL